MLAAPKMKFRELILKLDSLAKTYSKFKDHTLLPELPRYVSCVRPVGEMSRKTPLTSLMIFLIMT